MKKLACAVCLLGILVPASCFSQVATGDLPWSPSMAGDSQPALDFVRRVLTCDSLACTLKVIRAQQELQQELIEGMEMRTIPLRQSMDGGKTWTETSVTIPVYRNPARLILGGCFGADLPFTATMDEIPKVANSKSTVFRPKPSPR